MSYSWKPLSPEASTFPHTHTHNVLREHREPSAHSRTNKPFTSTKPNTSTYGNITEDFGGKCPRHFHSTRQETSDSEASLEGKDVDKESHSDSRLKD